MGIFAKKSAWEQEWTQVRKKEHSFLEKGKKKKESFLTKKLESVVPEGLQKTLDGAFFKAFTLIFEKGTGVIEKTYKKEEKERIYKVNRYAAELKADRKNLSAFRKEAAKSGNRNLLLSGVEGIGLGVLGIGLPDIPLFTGMILKSLYEISASYGYPYEEYGERMFILRLIEAALSGGGQLAKRNQDLEHFMKTRCWKEEEPIAAQTERTAKKLSGELLYMKFLQGIPLAGVVGGAYDAVYLKKIQQYAGIQYQKRFLMEQNR